MTNENLTYWLSLIFKRLSLILIRFSRFPYLQIGNHESALKAYEKLGKLRSLIQVILRSEEIQRNDTISDCSTNFPPNMT